MTKKQTKNPIEHERKYIEFLEKQIEYMKKNNKEIDKINELKYKLSKSRIVLKILEKPK